MSIESKHSYILVLFFPIPSGVYKDGGTREFTALTYKIVMWNHITAEDVVQTGGWRFLEMPLYKLDFTEMVSIKEFRLQPLRIPSDWNVKYNLFSEYDPNTDGYEFSYELCEDLLQLENDNLLIDLGWYPEGDIEGSYKLYLVDTTNASPFELPLEVFTSKSRQKIIDKIEFWTNSEFFQEIR